MTGDNNDLNCSPDRGLGGSIIAGLGGRRRAGNCMDVDAVERFTNC